jgi:hypothetical protein
MTVTCQREERGYIKKKKSISIDEQKKLYLFASRLE